MVRIRTKTYEKGENDQEGKRDLRKTYARPTRDLRETYARPTKRHPHKIKKHEPGHCLHSGGRLDIITACILVTEGQLMTGGQPCTTCTYFCGH